MIRALLFAHRWLGVALCLLFLLWFPSGIAIMYWGYPEVTDRDRLARGADLDAATIVIQPTDIFATLGLPDPPRDIRLSTYNGRPVYRYTDAVGESVVYADTGDFIEDDPAPPEQIAARWLGEGASVRILELSDVPDADQWTLQLPVAELQPLWKYSFSNGDDVYVSGATGDVVQHTTRASRIGAYLGPITHWLYFTPLRKHGPAWSRVVIWSSAAATVSAIVGVVLGAWFTVPHWRVPYTGQKRWHLVLGLIFGVATITWAFSGMLSMDPFPSFSGTAARRAEAAAAIPSALRNEIRMTEFLQRPPQQALDMLGDARIRELAYSGVAGDAAYIATLADGSTRVVPVSGSIRDAIDRDRLVNTIQRAAEPFGGAMLTELREYDAYYLDRNGELPLPVLLVELNDEYATRYYVDPVRGRIVGAYDSRRWVNRWLYRGLHSLDFPWLYRSRPFWDIVVITFMLGGTALTVTSLVLAWRLLARTLVRSPGL
ncbi:MAG: hypothetical protein AB7P99_01585 [Vicinamibacterales bacterium]